MHEGDNSQQAYKRHLKLFQTASTLDVDYTTGLVRHFNDVK